MLLFFAILVTALALAPAGAHFFELPNKIGLSEADYFTVQHIYNGWALFGGVIFTAIILDAVLTWTLRGQRGFGGALVALICTLAGLTVFFTWTYPANVATANWTTVPDNWQTLRAQWEYSHAANAVLTFGALGALVWVAAVRTSGDLAEGA
jgi:hypothetical protein